MAERLVWNVTTPEGASYRGPAEVGVALLRGPPEQIAPTRLMGQAATTIAAALQTSSEPLLRMRAWADTSPPLWTNYRFELTIAASAVTARPGYAAQASPFPFLVVGAILLALGLIVLAAWQISLIEWGPLADVGLWVIAAVLAVVLFRRSR